LRIAQHQEVGMNGGELITDFLVRAEVPYVVGLCGHGDIGMLDALLRREVELPFISVQHEAAAGFIADAYYRIKRRPLATLTSCGPGSAQILVALGAALMDSSAMIAITGDVATSQFGRAPFQELGRHYQADFPSAVRPFVKRAYQPTRADQLPLMLRQAYTTAVSGRPGPVNVDVPLNLFAEDAPDAVHVPGRAARSGAAPEDLRAAVDLLLSARRPVIVVGAGAADGTTDPAQVRRLVDDLAALSAETGIPVVSSPAGKDLAPEDSLGPAGRNGTLQANRATRNADVILALGTRFDDRSTSSWLPGYTYSIPPTRLIQVHIDPAELDRNYPAEIAIAATPVEVLAQLLEAVRGRARPAPRRAWLDDIERWRAEWARHTSSGKTADSSPIRPERAIAELRGTLPSDGIVLADVGVHHNWLVQHFETGGPGTLLQSWGYAAMGFGVAGALGARLAAPDRPVVAVVGDGGFLMLPSVVATAVAYDLPAVWLVWNNGGFISIRDQQVAYFGKEYATSFTHSVDFAAMARSMGADGIRVSAPGDLGAALKAALDSGRPTVIDVLVDDQTPQPAVATWELPPKPHPEPTVGWPDPLASKGTGVSPVPLEGQR
jgi:acetolactate synthase-1/2/3 large subunit